MGDRGFPVSILGVIAALGSLGAGCGDSNATPSQVELDSRLSRSLGHFEEAGFDVEARAIGEPEVGAIVVTAPERAFVAMKSDQAHISNIQISGVLAEDGAFLEDDSFTWTQTACEGLLVSALDRQSAESVVQAGRLCE